MNGHKAKSIRREMARLHPKGYADPYYVKKQRINPMWQAKKRIALALGLTG